MQQLDKVEQGEVGIRWEGKAQSIFASQSATIPDAGRTRCGKSPQGQEMGAMDTIFSERPREDEKAENFLIEMNLLFQFCELFFIWLTRAVFFCFLKFFEVF